MTKGLDRIETGCLDGWEQAEQYADERTEEEAAEHGPERHAGLLELRAPGCA